MPVTPTCVHRRRLSSTASPGAAPPSHKECSPGSPTCHRGSSLPRGHSAHFLFVFVDGICLIAGVVPCMTCLVLNDFLVFSGKRLIVFDRAGMMFNPSTCSTNLTTFATLSCNLSCTDFMIFADFKKQNHLLTNGCDWFVCLLRLTNQFRPHLHSQRFKAFHGEQRVRHCLLKISIHSIHHYY